VNTAALLATLTSTLRQIQSSTPADKAAWDADAERRLAIERLWIMAGNAAEAYRKAVDIPPRVEPWAELYGFRSVLAHALPGDIASDRVWHETTVDLPRLLEQGEAVSG
jgi:uncharacterized protein with HEPN domain